MARRNMLDGNTATFVTQLSDVLDNALASDEWAIADLEKQLKVRLPAAYKAFLLLAGGGWEPLEGSQYALADDLVELQRSGKRIFATTHRMLADDAFVFVVHQGFTCNFFLLNDGNDPAIFECVEGLGAALKVSAHFTHWLRSVKNAVRDLKARR